jgi:hypothetical protein
MLETSVSVFCVCFFDALVIKLQEKLDTYKFGLPTLTLQAECKQYEAIRDEIDTVNILMNNR